jgi:polysaccharide transporter, PST family
MTHILKNMFWLLIVQLANFALPLINLPYLGRVLGVEKFGIIMFVLSFMQFLMLVSDYGFNLSATKQISINRENSKIVNEIFSSILIIKLFLVLLCFITLIILFEIEDKIGENRQLFILFFGMVIGNALFPLWFFQGIEKMKVSSLLNVLTKTIFTFSIFLLVKSKQDINLIPICYSIGYLLSGFLGVLIAIWKFKITIYTPKFKVIINYFKESTMYFLSRISVSVYSVANTFIITLALGPVAAGYFSAAEKLYNAILSVISVISDVLFPYMSKNKNIYLFKKISVSVLILSFMGVLLAFFISNNIITIIYGSEFSKSITIFKLMLISTVFAIPSILIGYPLLASYGLEKYTNNSVLIASFTHILFLIIFIPMKSIALYSSTLIITQFVVLAIRLLGVRRFSQIKEVGL